MLLKAKARKFVQRGSLCPARKLLVTAALVRKNAFLTAQSCSAKQLDSRLVSLQIDLKISAHHTGAQ